MALKEKALRRLSDKFHARSIPFAAGGAYMLSLHGYATSWHRFDIYVSRESWDAASGVLTRLGMKSDEHIGEKACSAFFHFDGADLCLYGGLPLAEGLVLHIPETGLEETDVFGSQVPLMPLEDWYALTRLSCAEPPLPEDVSFPGDAPLLCIQGAEYMNAVLGQESY